MERLKQLRKERRWTQNDLAKAVHLSKGAISNYENGNRKPPHETLVQLANVLGVSTDYLLAHTDVREVAELQDGRIVPKEESASGSVIQLCHTFPVIGDVAAGFNSGEAEETYTGDEIEVPLSWMSMPPSEYFVLRASGDSMWPDIKDGDLLLVQHTPVVDSGAIAIVIYDGGAGTVKEVKFSPGGAYIDLIPRNPEYAPKRIEGEEAASVIIQGEVKRVIREL